ncbi:MAG: hypothetical protein KGJ05_06745, partial [Alphaproteobacteria bacterium]|nr:hypothetical protein [Alphaproteobacteria bacterium]
MRGTIYIAVSLCALLGAGTPLSADPGYGADDLAVVNRIGWGVTASEMADVEHQGLDAWLEAQLHPPADD